MKYLARNQLLTWLDEQLKEAKRALRARQESARTWATGSTADWRKVGCRLTQEQRFEEAIREKRVAKKYQRDVEILEALIAIVSDQAVIAM